jgi:hypothetical protein
MWFACPGRRASAVVPGPVSIRIAALPPPPPPDGPASIWLAAFPPLPGRASWPIWDCRRAIDARACDVSIWMGTRTIRPVDSAMMARPTSALSWDVSAPILTLGAIFPMAAPMRSASL